MRKISRIFAVLLTLSVAAVAVMLLNFNAAPDFTKPGTDGDSPTVREYDDFAFREYEANEAYVKKLGRTCDDGGELCLSYSGSGIEFYCESSFVQLVLSPAHNISVMKNKLPRIGIFVDGEQVSDIQVESETICNVTTKNTGSVVRVVKLSEGMYSSLNIKSIGVYSKKDIAPTEKSDLTIEFIGDSITCGYGIDAGSRGYFSTATENFSKAYAYLTAESLGADYSALCYSGYGVFSGFTSNGRRNSSVILPEYEKACFFDSSCKWDFNRADNDIVVINLGTNDASYCRGNSFRKMEFISAYTELLRLVREKNTDAYILCILGDMNNSLFPSIETAVNEFMAETGDSRVEAFTVDFKMGENEIVIDGHPGEDSNRIAAEFLTAKINQLLGGVSLT